MLVQLRARILQVNQERESKPTGLNNNTVAFSHSVYIVSDYFTDYSPLPKGSEQHGADVIGYKTNQAKTMNALQKSVANMLRSVYEEYMLGYADTAISEMKARSSFPKFSDDIYGQMKERDLVGVTKAIYCAVPDVFVKLKPIQEKSLIGFLALALNLVRKISTNFKIYAMTWDDVFTNFRIKHDHLLRKLRFRQEVIAQEVQQEIDAATKEEAADVLRDRVTESA